MQMERRLTKRAYFEKVYKEGRRWRNELLVLQAASNGLAVSRFGFSVGKRVSKKAVERNRLKRLLRESVRATPTLEGWDMIFVARKVALDASFHQIKEAVEGLLHRGRLYRQVDQRGLEKGR